MPDNYIDWREKSKGMLLHELQLQGFVLEYAWELVEDVFTLVDRAYEYGVRNA